MPMSLGMNKLNLDKIKNNNEIEKENEESNKVV
jgi:hypothetical protein